MSKLERNKPEMLRKKRFFVRLALQTMGIIGNFRKFFEFSEIPPFLVLTLSFFLLEWSSRLSFFRGGLVQPFYPIGGPYVCSSLF